LTDIVDLDGSEAIRRRLTPSSTSTVVVAARRLAAQNRSTCNGNDSVNDDVPLRCRQPQRLGVNDQVDVPRR
jgi:hypothetical protein